MPDEENHERALGTGTPSSNRSRSFFGRNTASDGQPVHQELQDDKGRPTRWSMGVLNDPTTHEVPGSVILLTSDQNQPLGLRNEPARTSASSMPTQPVQNRRQSHQSDRKKTTPDGKIILTPQPEESRNDPLNWPTWRRDAALLSLGIYCMVGGGMTPILAAGFTNVASTYDVTVPKVALTTGLYMMGLGVGSVFASPTAILYGKRPVYLVSAVIFIATSIWCAASPTYISLLVARIFQGISVSPVECLPSATIAEIFFLHERAYRLGIYTLLLLGGKNLVPLVSATIIQSLEWRWVFWIVAMVVGFCGVLLFFFVPETFWDRTPVPKSRSTSKNASRFSLLSGVRSPGLKSPKPAGLDKQGDGNLDDLVSNKPLSAVPSRIFHPKRPSIIHRPSTTRHLHVGFAQYDPEGDKAIDGESVHSHYHSHGAEHEFKDTVEPAGGVPPTPALHNFDSPWYRDIERDAVDYITAGNPPRVVDDMNVDGGTSFSIQPQPISQRYTATLRDRPALTFAQQLKPFNGRLHQDKWLRVAIRPFILFAYPAVLWSAVVYSCAVGWLIVLSESVAVIYRSRTTYGFSALSTGLIYLSPFIGGVLGTAVAGRVSDMVVRAMSQRNGGLYEPEFRLVMAAPVAVTTVIGLMGFGWSAEVHDAWIVPTVFFGVISFGCSLGSTTAITFCVDSYRQYAGEALVTLNFSKNVFHGLVFSLFFPAWLEHEGSKSVFIWLGVIQLILMAFTVPMYIFGKRARMWTVRKNLMEKF
ncbi:hypothetical protein QTJ16_000437 [Diplocarpon rosae]|uniref:Major facilitator superfamily (MFS) profile domain-containing protein n=1 Tax=Diplocarpon rosae TaxID=946125 RepID=A0AAD9T6B3_9HELO|nr:hypothetical protein QTJ16_000437 [Diplocarpon rosae]